MDFAAAAAAINLISVIDKREEKEKEKAWKNNPLGKVAKTTMNTVTGDIGRKIARGLLGGITKGLFK